MIYRVAKFVKTRPAITTLMAVFILMIGPVVWLPMLQVTLGQRLDAMNRADPIIAGSRTLQSELLLSAAWYVLPACWLVGFVLLVYGLRKILKKQWSIGRR
jgi:hypothetical protein